MYNIVIKYCNRFCLILYKYCLILYSFKLYNTCKIFFLNIVWYCNVLLDVVYSLLQYLILLVDIVIVNFCVPAGTAWLGWAILVMTLHIQLMLRKEAMCWILPTSSWTPLQFLLHMTGQVVFELTWCLPIGPNLPYAEINASVTMPIVEGAWRNLWLWECNHDLAQMATWSLDPQRWSQLQRVNHLVLHCAVRKLSERTDLYRSPWLASWHANVYSFTPQQDSLRLENRGKVLASLERLGKTPVIPLLGPWHVEPGNVFKFAQPTELEDRGTNISAKGMADTAGQYRHKSRAASKCQNSRQYHGVVPRHYRGIPH